MPQTEGTFHQKQTCDKCLKISSHTIPNMIEHTAHTMPFSRKKTLDLVSLGTTSVMYVLFTKTFKRMKLQTVYIIHKQVTLLRCEKLGMPTMKTKKENGTQRAEFML